MSQWAKFLLLKQEDLVWIPRAPVTLDKEHRQDLQGVKANQFNQIGGLWVHWDTLSQKIKWSVIEKDFLMPALAINLILCKYPQPEEGSTLC